MQLSSESHQKQAMEFLRHISPMLHDHALSIIMCRKFNEIAWDLFNHFEPFQSIFLEIDEFNDSDIDHFFNLSIVKASYLIQINVFDLLERTMDLSKLVAYWLHSFPARKESIISSIERTLLIDYLPSTCDLVSKIWEILKERFLASNCKDPQLFTVAIRNRYRCDEHPVENVIKSPNGGEELRIFYVENDRYHLYCIQQGPPGNNDSNSPLAVSNKFVEEYKRSEKEVEIII